MMGRTTTTPRSRQRESDLHLLSLFLVWFAGWSLLDLLLSKYTKNQPAARAIVLAFLLASGLVLYRWSTAAEDSAW